MSEDYVRVAVEELGARAAKLAGVEAKYAELFFQICMNPGCIIL